MRYHALTLFVALLVLGCPPTRPVAPGPGPIEPRPAVALPKPVPSSRPLSPDGVIGAATLFDHSCILRRAGQVQCWGRNSYGQLGNGVREPSAELVDVAGVVDAQQVGTGRDFSCALRRAGTIACWGNNEDGQLGNGDGAEPGALSLTQVGVKNLRNIRQISLGEYHGCALDEGGAVSCWGNGSNGQIGSDEQRAFSSARPIEQLAPVRQVASGANHVCALETRGTVQCWGRNTEGQLGDGLRGSRIKPVSVKGLDDAVYLASGHNHSCAVRRDGSLTCWGDNKSLQLGPEAGTDRKRNTPIPVPGLRQVEQVAGGDQHTCARLTSGRVSCWGANARGQLGHQEEGPARATAASVDEVGDATDLALGAACSCALWHDGELICWGATKLRIGAPGPSEAQ